MSRAKPPARLRLARIAGSVARHAAVLALLGVILFPFYWMAVTSLSSAQDVFAWPPRLLPSSLHWENYPRAIRDYAFWRYFWNSLVVASLATVSIVVVDSLAGYAFARLPFRGMNAVFAGVVISVMIPLQITMIPLFIMFKHAPLLGGNDILSHGGRGLVDSYAGMVIPWMATTFGTMLMREYFRLLPGDLIDAARLDGLNEFRIFVHVYFPLAAPATASVALLTFTDVWNTFLWPLIITSSTGMRTVQVEIAAVKDQYFTDWHLLMAFTVLSCLPVLIVYLIGQKHFARGIAFSGLKG